MKRFILVIQLFLFCTSLNLIGQSALDAPLGLKFGCDRSTVKAVIKAKRGTFNSENQTNFGVNDSYTDFKIGTENVFIGFFKFVDNKLFEIQFMIEPTNEPAIEDKYNDICEIIETKYGKGESFRQFKYPYEDKKEDVLSAIRGGYATISTYWMKFANDDGITVEIVKGQDLMVRLGYQNGSLMQLALDKQKKKNTSEF